MNLLKANKKGFTLIELLVASALGGIGFLGLAALHANSIKATHVGRSRSVAITIAQEQLEVMRRLPAEQRASFEDSVNVGGRSYTTVAAVEPVAPGESTQVTVDIGWADQFGPHTVELVTVVPR